MDDDVSPAELAARISGADRPSAPQENRLRLQWGADWRLPTHVPFWFAAAFVGVLVVAWVADALFL